MRSLSLKSDFFKYLWHCFVETTEQMLIKFAQNLHFKFSARIVNKKWYWKIMKINYFSLIFFLSIFCLDQKPGLSTLLGAWYQNQGLRWKLPHHNEYFDLSTMEIGSGVGFTFCINVSVFIFFKLGLEDPFLSNATSFNH